MKLKLHKDKGDVLGDVLTFGDLKVGEIFTMTSNNVPLIKTNGGTCVALSGPAAGKTFKRNLESDAVLLGRISGIEADDV